MVCMASAQLIQLSLNDSSQVSDGLNARPTAISRGSANPVTRASPYFTLPSPISVFIVAKAVFVREVESAQYRAKAVERLPMDLRQAGGIDVERTGISCHGDVGARHQ